MKVKQIEREEISALRSEQVELKKMEITTIDKYPATLKETRDYIFNDKDFFKKPFCNLIHGDATQVVRKLPYESIDMIMFSPSYYGLRDYHVEGQIGLEDHPDKYIKKLVDLCYYLKLVLKKSGSMYIVIGDTYFGHHGGGPSSFERKKGLTWKDKSKRYRTNPFHHVKFEGWLKPKQLMLMPNRLAIALQEAGWVLRNDIIWQKSNPMPSSAKDRFSPTYEHVFFFVKESKSYFSDLDAVRVPCKKETLKRYSYGKKIKSGKYLKSESEGQTKGEYAFPEYAVQFTKLRKIKEEELKTEDQVVAACLSVGINPDNTCIICGKKFRKHSGKFCDPKGKNPGDIWTLSTRGYKGKHFAVYPESLCMKPIKFSCPKNGIILDPMCGSGTTLKVARDLDRNAIGIDLSKYYISLSKSRLEEAGYEVRIYDYNGHT